MNKAATAQKLNTTEVDYSYRQPVELFGTFDKITGIRTSHRVGTFGQIKILSDIYSFSVGKDGNRSICTRTLPQFVRDLNVSESTVRRGLKLGAEKGYVTGVEGRKNAYQFDTDANYTCGGHYRLEAWMTRPIPFENGLLVLTNAQQALLSYFNSECNRAPQELSASDIAEKLDISVPTAQKAIDKITDKNTRLVYRLEVGVNGHKKSKYIINRKLFRELNKAEAKKQKAIEKALKAKTANEGQNTAQDDRSEAIRREYCERKNMREEALRRTLARAMADFEYKTAAEALQRLAPKVAFAEVRNMPDLPKLQAEAQRLEEQRTAALKRLKIDEAELSEEFYIRCQKCRDTLHLPTGRVCDCFTRGAPPGNG